MSKVVILSGAGISAESGITTFRESDGLWENYDVETICNWDSLDKNEALTLDFYDQRRKNIQDKKPNKAHIALQNLKKKYPDDITVITQNVDNLFEKAGFKKEEVLHLHGYLPEVKCRARACEKIYDIGYGSIYDFNNGDCKECGGKLRPNIVLFGEMAPRYEDLNRELQDCQFFVVIGTSGNVIDVNSTAQFADYSILNNLKPSSAIQDKLFTKVIYDKASIAIDEIANLIEDYLS